MTSLRVRLLMAGNWKQRVATTDELIEWTKSHKADIRRLGGNPELSTVGLTTLQTSRIQANDLQESYKVQLKNQTKLLNQIDRQVFEATTSTIDAYSGLFGKFSNEAVQLRRIRAKVRKPSPTATPSA